MIKKILKLSKNIMLPTIVALFNIIIIFYPREIIYATKTGLVLWYNNVLPSLLPFLISISLLMNLGLIDFIGTLLEPLMKIFFGVSGIGAFPLICGATSGYPIGAKITSELRENNSITKNDAQKIISFTNNSGPLFIIGSIGVAMFNNQSVGILILIAHYLGAITIGLLFKNKNHSVINTKHLIKKAYLNMINTRKKNNKSFALILKQSVQNSIESILMIGGYIVIFSVIIKVIELFNIIVYIDKFLIKFANINLNDKILNGFIFGLLEMTNGIKILSQNGLDMQSIICIIFIVSFGGFCIQLQSINFIQKTDINIFLYIIAKLFHAIISCIYGILLYPFFNFEQVSDVFLDYNQKFLYTLQSSIWALVYIIFIILIISILTNIILVFKKHT